MTDMNSNRTKNNIFISYIVLLVAAMIIIPLPVQILDILMAVNLLFSLAVLLLVIFTEKPSGFSVFPAMLLVSTMFGLGLNVSSTRLILTKGAEFDGKLVRAFGNFVVGSSGKEGLVVGFVIFIIFILIQLIVITKGANRAAEVSARFSLDAMNQKNMSVESDVAGGFITAEEGEKRKREYSRETDFYKSMDGASKFVSGNVKVSIFITLVNIIGGMIIGMLIRGESFSLAVANYTSLTIGDGLVTQFPSILISLATAFIVTSADGSDTLASGFAKQFSGRPEIFYIISVFSFILVFLPGFRRAWYIFLLLGILLVYIGNRLKKGTGSQKDTDSDPVPETKPADRSIRISPVTDIQPLYLALGYGLCNFAGEDRTFLDRITELRKEISAELGFAVPVVKVMDDLDLGPLEYSIKIRDVEAARGVTRLNRFIAVADSAGQTGNLEREFGESFREPVFGKEAFWITAEEKEKAREAGCIVSDIPSLIIVHMGEIIRRNAAILLDRQTVQSMLDTLARHYPAVVREALDHLTLGEIHNVLRNLLTEQVSVRDLPAVLEILCDNSGRSKDAEFLTEKVRVGLRRQISHKYADAGMTLHAVTLSKETEDKLAENLKDIRFREKLASAITDLIGHRNMVLLCRKDFRSTLGLHLAGKPERIPVLTPEEIASDIRIEFHGRVEI